MSAIALQIQVRGLLDGATPFVPPATLPDPVNGVIKIDAGAGIDVGDFGLLDLTPFDTQQACWLRSFHVLFGTGANAGRALISTPGQLTNTPIVSLVPDAGGAPAAIMSAMTAAPRVVIPPASRLLITGATEESFSTPVAGPHFIYLEIDPIADSAEYNAALKLESNIGRQMTALGDRFDSFQAVAATSTDEFVISAPNTIVSRVTLKTGDAAAAGESMAYAITARIQGGVSFGTIATFTQDDTTPANTVVPVTLEVPTYLRAGDSIRVARTYVAGGGPTPLTNTHLVVETSAILADRSAS